ncbi:MAG: hypothetical protein JRN20_12120 [Nitrososphaerota archaeon]|nr:hypothetical protein [Nitrososphaerota archaeon]
MNDGGLKEILRHVERYLLPVITRDSPNSLSREENKILALQQIALLNQQIGLIGRTNRKEMESMKALQTFVNSITIGVKNDNVPQIKYGLTQARNLILSFSKEDCAGQNL